jgi:transcriptional antiterminator RfaH
MARSLIMAPGRSVGRCGSKNWPFNFQPGVRASEAHESPRLLLDRLSHNLLRVLAFQRVSAGQLHSPEATAQKFDGKPYDFSELGIVNPVVRSVTQSSASLALVPEPVWFCLRTQPKREHLAATALRRQFGVECFSPRLRFRKMTQRGPVWFVEAMFPGYLFAKFTYSTQHRAVENSHGIRGIVHFGDRLATLPENIVTALQSRVGSEEIVTLDCSIADGAFQGLEAVVTHLLPARDRIRVLFDFLGRSVEMEVSTAKVLAA